MHNIIIILIGIISVISGSSQSLQLMVAFLCILYFLYNHLNLIFIGNATKKKTILAFICGFFFCISILILPSSNYRSFLITIVAIIVSYFTVYIFMQLTNRERASLFTYVLSILLIGDLIHISGMLGSDMQLYKSVVGFDLISNLDRETGLSILGNRYHGFFAEPSYHGAYTGLLTPYLWVLGYRKRSIIFYTMFFVLCPTPVMLLSSLGLTIMISFFSNSGDRFLVKKALSLIAVLLLLTVVVAFYDNRINFLYSDYQLIMSGYYVNSSEAIRLIYPVQALIQHINDAGLGASSLICQYENICYIDAQKVPLFSFVVFFGAFGVMFIVVLMLLITNQGIFPVIFALLFCSILSSGGGFSINYWLLVMLMLEASRHKFLLPKV